MSGESTIDEALASMLSTCTVRRPWAEQDEGPYHLDAQPVRRNIVEDREGTAMQLGLRLAGHDGEPRTGAVVEIWQCDALGRYSGFPPPDAAPSAPRAEYLSGQTFLRGRQHANDAGLVEFATIYPGWYPGRTVHIHLMVHLDGVILTSQLYFPGELSDHVLSQQPYARRPGRDTTNETDEIFPTGGDPAVLDVTLIASGVRAGICLVLPDRGGPA